MAKKHISVWIDEDLLRKCDAELKASKIGRRSEFVEDALELYIGFLHSKDSERFISKTLMKTFQGTMNTFERRMSRQMFKQAVESAKIFWLIVRGFKLNPGDVDDLHEDCIDEVKTINGAIRFPYKQEEDDE